jgi:hypothetical protein
MNQARYTRNLEAARAALAAGTFASAAAQQEAAQAACRAYEEVRTELHAGIDSDAHADLFWSVPGDLHLWRERHTAAVVAQYPGLAGACAKAVELATLRTAIKAAPVVKPETKKVAAAKKVAEIKEAVAAGVASPIAMAIAPLRAEAAAHALEWATNDAAQAKAKWTAAGFDLDVVAPSAPRGASKAECAMARAAAAHYLQFVTRAPDSDAFVWSETCAQRYIARTVSETEADFDAFVLKLDGKVGAHTAAALVSGATWAYSLLRVTLADGAVQDWKTQRITNCSSLGKLFNQWPTRLVK